jgi:hypothetical protein
MYAGDCFASLAMTVTKLAMTVAKPAMTVARREPNVSITAPARMAPSRRMPLHKLACDDDALQFVGALADHQ